MNLQLVGQWKNRLISKYPNLSPANWIARFSTRIRIRKLLNTGEPIRLYVGSYKMRLPGWLSGDINHGEIYLDALKRLPFNDNCVDLIFSEHFIEHLTVEQSRFFSKNHFVF